MEQTLVTAITAHAGRADIVAALRALYSRVGTEIEIRRPRCDASGKCCNFDAYGHRLYVTTLELIAFASQLSGFSRKSSKNSLPILSHNAGGACVFQIGGLCGVHPIRPFGCRMFYCDPSATQWQIDAYERFHAELKSLHRQLGVPYLYVEWRWAVETLGLAS